MTEPRLTALKVGYKGEIHRLRIDLTNSTYEQVDKLFQETYSLEPNTFVMQYYTPAGKRVVVKDQATYEEVCKIYLEDDQEQVKSLKFMAQTRTSAALYEATEPILKAIEKLLAQLNKMAAEVSRKAKDEDWEGQCRRKMTITGEVIHKVAKDVHDFSRDSIKMTGVALNDAAQVSGEAINQAAQVSGGALNQAAEEARKAISLINAQVQEFPYEDVVEEATEGIKLATTEIHNFAQEFISQVSQEFGIHETFSVPAPVPAPVHQAEEPIPQPQTAAAAPVESDAESSPVENAVEEAVQAPPSPIEEAVMVAPPSPIAGAVMVEAEIESNASTPNCSDDEWDVVANPDTEEEEHSIWETQLTLIREIFSSCDASQVTNLLELHSGNVHEVLNVLAEQQQN